VITAPPLLPAISEQSLEDLVAWMAGRGRWELALAYSATMFTVASVCWLFINPRRVIVYAPADKQRLQAEGMLE